jgi:hypothetical protein
MRPLANVVRAIALIVLSGVLLSCSGGDESPPSNTERIEATEILRASIASPESNEVRIVFVTSGYAGCREFATTDVEENSTIVTVTVSVKTVLRDCPDSGAETEKTVQLRSPFETRALIDGSTGQPVNVQPL